MMLTLLLHIKILMMESRESNQFLNPIYLCDIGDKKFHELHLNPSISHASPAKQSNLLKENI